jgi:hypothetical protein
MPQVIRRGETVKAEAGREKGNEGRWKKRKSGKRWKTGKTGKNARRGDGGESGKAGNGGKEGKWETRKNARSGDRMKE